MRKASQVSARRSERIEAVRRELRAVRTRSILFSEAVAKRLSINATDLVCGDILWIEGPMTAGRLAEAAGVTTGAMTSNFRRLEAAGYIVRAQDETDARKVVSAPARQWTFAVDDILAPLNQAIETVGIAYSDEDLQLIISFASAVTESLKRQAALQRVAER